MTLPVGRNYFLNSVGIEIWQRYKEKIIIIMDPPGVFIVYYLFIVTKKRYTRMYRDRYMTTTNRKETWHTSNEYVQRIDLHEYCIYMTVTKN